ncbi:MAG: redox-sensing transcriptional repressor Rex [Clostridia bacterium]
MDKSKKISFAVIRRLPRYYRYLSDLLRDGIERISSKELSERMGITASQIRQDLNNFGGFGQQGYGYNVVSLNAEIGRILGIDHSFKAIIIGAGNMGHALANYPNFAGRGYEIVGIFDISSDLIGTKAKEDGDADWSVIRNIDTIEEFVKKNKVDIAMLTVPYQFTSAVAEKVVALGIKALWNFSAMDLKLPGDVVIENVHLSDSLMVLGFRLHNLQN